MSFEGKAKLASLVPAVDEAIGSTTVAKAFLIESRAQELGVGELAHSTVPLKSFGGVGRVPKLQGPRRDCAES